MKKTLLLLTIPLLMYAHTLPELFDALKAHSQTKADEILVKKGGIFQKQATAKLYPTINLFGSFDNYSSPTNMRPFPPNELSKDKTMAQPFSYNIYRAGANISMPIFIKSIYTMADYAKTIQKSSQAKKKLNIIKNEALIVGANANFEYLVALKRSLDAKELSLLETETTIKIKVDNGRTPASALYKIDDSLNQISIAKNNIDIQTKNIISTIETLTGIVIDNPINMDKNADIQKNDYASLEPLRVKLYASTLNIKAEKEKLYPALSAHGNYTFSKGESYNNYKDINEEYGDVGLFLNIPLLTMSQYSEISLAKLQLRADEIKLQKSKDELIAKARMLQSSLGLLENSKELYKKSIKNKKQLLEIAKVNYKSGRLSTEEYLRYEDVVVSEEANLYKTKASWWQTTMQLAVIYANNIEEIVK